uniref:E-selectin-like n=1 Tax=Styela clava TaxID=7725 RepID=UPI00193A2206|nr:E-selectin-like [Styela clava]XP_039254675.1 E-selectin-like [Styela clava]
MYVYILLFGILLSVGQTFGLKCWTCVNAKSNRQCNKIGYWRTCDAQEIYCHNEVQVRNGVRGRVTKRCAQAPACNQNAENVTETRCNGNPRKSAACSCCCNQDNCNAPLFRCGGAEMCKRPRYIQNGEISCPKKINIGTVCKLRCQRGFIPNRNNVIKCQHTPGNKPERAFTNLLGLKCIRKQPRCPSLKNTIVPRGTFSCKNVRPHIRKFMKNFQGTTCTFKCNSNAFMSGNPSLVCNAGHWSHGIPRCIVGRCPAPQKEELTFRQCTAGNKFGSMCSYTCAIGLKIIGDSISVCGPTTNDPSRGEWDNGIPKCKIVQCPSHVSVSNGEALLTNDNFEGSVCIFSCKPGFDLVGTPFIELESVCEDDGTGVGKWSEPAPTCSQITCDPVFKAPENGAVFCTDDNKWGSACTFRCNSGYDLGDTYSNSIRCFCEEGRNRDNIGEWSRKPPTCTAIKCPSVRKAPINGYVTCTNANFAESVCTFRCKPGFDLDMTPKKTFTNRCVDRGYGTATGEWDNFEPGCRRRISCLQKHEFLANGNVECTNGNLVGSACKFTCYKGYRLVGRVYSNCVELLADGDDIAEWTSKPPRCEASHCPFQWYDKDLVMEDCVGRKTNRKSFHLLGTKCHYTCKRPGYYPAMASNKFVQARTTVATCLSSLSWSTRPPRCFVKKCPHIPTPKHGYVPDCSNANNFGSRCEFWCKYPHKISHKSKLLCVSKGRNGRLGRWNKSPPTCDSVK